MTRTMPSAQAIIEEALLQNPNLEINSLHGLAFKLMISHRARYYEESVNKFLSKLDISDELRRRIKQEMLKPIKVENKEYSNFMEEVSRRVSQAFQPISGNIAELCAERELTKAGLVKGINYTRKKERTDFIIYYPDISKNKTKHRIEVKNVKLRERATRGLSFDGDSLFGFFNDENELTESNVEVIDQLCTETGGYCYIPPATINKMQYKGIHFRPNTVFGHDMWAFAMTGEII